MLPLPLPASFLPVVFGTSSTNQFPVPLPVHARLHWLFRKVTNFCLNIQLRKFRQCELCAESRKKYKSERQTNREWESEREGGLQGKQWQKKSEMRRTRKIKNFRQKKKARSGRKQKRVIKFHKNPLLAMLTYSVCRSSSCVRERNALTARQSPENLGSPALTLSLSLSESPTAIAARAAFCGTHFASTEKLFNYWYCLQPFLLLLRHVACGNYWGGERGKQKPKPKSCHTQYENVAYISYFCSTLSPSLSFSVYLSCRSATVADSSTRRSTITGTTIKTKYNK